VILVAIAVLLRGPLDVGDPVAPLARVLQEGHVPAGDALLLLVQRVVDEPLELELRLVPVAGVLALVPDRRAHLEVADRVRVAEVDVRHPGLHQRGHDRQLAGEARLVRLARHPRGDLLLGSVVARVDVGDVGEPDRCVRY
jgi:hypothetical protein